VGQLLITTAVFAAILITLVVLGSPG